MLLPVTVCCYILVKLAIILVVDLDAMDPDIEIMHVVNVDDLKPQSLIILHLSREYNRRVPNCDRHISEEGTNNSLNSFSAATAKVICHCDKVVYETETAEKTFCSNSSCDQIDIIWKERQQRNPRLFNGTKFRIHNVTNLDDDGKNVVMFLGITDYKEYLGTNWAPNVKALQEKGKVLHNNSQAFLSDALGVGASVITKDNCIILLWRSRHCAEAPEMWDIPGGHAEPKKIVGDKPLKEIDVSSMSKSAVIDEIFDSILQEVTDEVNIPLEHLGAPLYMGTHRNTTSAGRPSLAFTISCSLSSEDIRAMYSQGSQQEADESTNITFVPVQEIATLEIQKQDIWKKMAPSAKGNLTVFSLTHNFKTS